MLIGLTGGIGSGKSTVISFFQELGVPCYIADIEAKKIMVSSDIVISKIKKLLGEEAYIDGNLNRNYISKQVFKNKALLQKLNSIVHPEVHQDLKKFAALQTCPYFLYESAILFENNNQHLCDKVIVVTADKEERIQRVMDRDQVDRAAVLARMQHQWEDEIKIKKADFVIVNQDKKACKEQVLALHQQLLAMSD
ncbi:dephospho-CoA kinase [Ochrovirga pacifica]|uniref:dephospho-CoA kinase n=1 Tax=Ochrovirga pacifica TaxID=1042376 RepID=UPI000255774C|nr:dephospho-CoA kinase [Ochrovirga pacifica]